MTNVSTRVLEYHGIHVWGVRTHVVPCARVRTDSSYHQLLKSCESIVVPHRPPISGSGLWWAAESFFRVED